MNNITTTILVSLVVFVVLYFLAKLVMPKQSTVIYTPQPSGGGSGMGGKMETPPFIQDTHSTAGQ